MKMRFLILALFLSLSSCCEAEKNKSLYEVSDLNNNDVSGYTKSVTTLNEDLETEAYWTIDKWKRWSSKQPPPNWVASEDDKWTPPLSMIEVGIHIDSIHRLSHSEQSFGAIASIWSQWSGELRGWDGEPLGNENPLQLLSFNNMDSDDFYRSSENSPYFSNGRYSSDLKIDGTFQTKFDYRLFPFDDQKIVIDIELDTDAYEALIFTNKPPTVSKDYNHILDYDVQKITTENLVKYHPTSYGIADYRENENFAAGLVRVSIFLKRTIINSFFEFILPLCVIYLILLANASGFLTDGSVKITLPPAALLSIIFVQQFTHSQLPRLDYLTFLDYLYIFTYVMVLLCFFEAILFKYREDKYMEKSSKIFKLQKSCKVSMYLLVFFGPGLSWWLASIG